MCVVVEWGWGSWVDGSGDGAKSMLPAVRETDMTEQKSWTVNGLSNTRRDSWTSCSVLSFSHTAKGATDQSLDDSLKSHCKEERFNSCQAL